MYRVPFVYMARDVIILMQTNQFRWPMEGVGPENRYFFPGSDPYSFFPDPDPAFEAGDQSGSRALMTKIEKK